MKNRLKKGDQVQILIGKERGKKGKIEKIYPKTDKVLVTGINLVKKHVKARGEGKPGGIIESPSPLSLSKVALVCPRCNQKTRVGFRTEKGQVKIRICRKCQQAI